MFAHKKEGLYSVDWTRPAQYQGEELFEISYDSGREIVEVNLIDEHGYSVHFNLSSFNEEELASIKEAIDREYDNLSYP